MERNGFQSVIIAVMAGILLIAGNPAYAAEQTPVKKEMPPAAATAKTDKKEPRDKNGCQGTVRQKRSIRKRHRLRRGFPFN